MITVESIQIGRVRTEGDPSARDLTHRVWTTGFYKLPVAGEVDVGSLGLVGDEVADTRHHGGPDKAVLCYAASHYPLWNDEYPDLPSAPAGFSAGGLGENLTVAGADESDVCIGDLFRLGSCRLQVSQPRQPCWKISRRWAIKTFTKRVTQSGRTGWYCRVIAAGRIASGQRLELIDRPHPNWSVARANDVMFGREVDRMAVFELMQLSSLAESWKRDLA